jgi:acetolactate synthase-1/2/3 large subunit
VGWTHRYDRRPATEKIKVGDVVASVLKTGATTAFGVISVHNIPILTHRSGQPLRSVMAQARRAPPHGGPYARQRRPRRHVHQHRAGRANACGALVEARFAGSPVLHITGQTATGNIDKGQGTVHDVPDQLGMLRSVSKAAYRVRTPETALGTLIQAATEALTPPMGPVSVEIPVDIQRAEIPRPRELDGLKLPIPAPQRRPGELKRPGESRRRNAAAVISNGAKGAARRGAEDDRPRHPARHEAGTAAAWCRKTIR